MRAIRAFDQLSARQLSLLVFLLTFAVYAALTPFVVRKWWLTGDEPHYLMVAHSLVHDGDLDLSNNYGDKDFVGFYVSEDLGPQVSTEAQPPKYSPRAVGLAVALAPAYALGGRVGVTNALSLVAALLAAGTFSLAMRLTGLRWPALAAALGFALTPPWLNYAFLVYPELTGGLLILFGLRGIVRHRDGPLAFLSVGLAAAGLPWLNARFVLYSAALLVTALVVLAIGRRRAGAAISVGVEPPGRRAGVPLQQRVVGAHLRVWPLTVSLGALLMPVALSTAGLAWYGLTFFGSPSPLASYATAGYQVGDLAEPGARIVDGLLGWLFDQRQGLFVYAPLTALALPGMVVALRRRQIEDLAPLPLLAIGYLSVGWAGFWEQWSVPPRYLVTVLPLLAVYAAYALAYLRSRLVWAVAALSLALALSFSFFLLRNPLTAYRSSIIWEYARRLPAEAVFTLPLPSFSSEIWLGDAEAVYLCPPRTLPFPSYYPTAWQKGVEAAASRSARRVDVTDAMTIENGTALPPGRYEAEWRIAAGNGAHLDLAAADGSILWTSEVPSGDGNAGFQPVPIRFDLRRFAEPGDLKFRAMPTASGPVAAEAILCGRRTNSGSRWLFAGLWLLVLGLFTTVSVRGARTSPPTPPPQGEGSLIGRAPVFRMPFREGVGALQARGLGPIVALAIVCLATIVLAIPERSRSYDAHELARGAGAAGVLRSVGRLVEDSQAIDGSALFAASQAGTGVLVYGPYEFFSPGQYIARFRLRRGNGDGADAVVAHLAVVASTVHTLAERGVSVADFPENGGYREADLPFTLGEQRALEFRVDVTGRSDLWLDQISVARAEAAP